MISLKKTLIYEFLGLLETLIEVLFKSQFGTYYLDCLIFNTHKRWLAHKMYLYYKLVPIQ